jgi:DNA helicase-2/ATP-dependent DNA helicase PcrA
VEYVQDFGGGFEPRRFSFSGQPAKSTAFARPHAETPPPSSSSERCDDSSFKIRDRVRHPRYGSGRIMKIEGSGDNVKLTIQFDGQGIKVFMEKYTPLERV